jgi:N utilization substance protein B
MTEISPSRPGRISDRQGGRRKARELVLRALFESDLSTDPVLEVLELSLGKFRLTLAGRDYALRLAKSAAASIQDADRALAGLLKGWELERLGTAERALLRLAFAELSLHREVDARVILDEAVRLAQRYGAEDAGSFVNGVLDPLARRLRPGELEAGVSRESENGRSA